MGRLAVLLLPICLSGCGLPPALSFATWAIDTVSYAASGKSISDHALSLAAGEDCAVIRAVEGERVCHASGEGEERLVVADTRQWTEDQRIDEDIDPHAAWQPPVSPAEVVTVEAPAGEVEGRAERIAPVAAFAPMPEPALIRASFKAQPADAESAPTPVADSAPDRRLLVVGSFARQANAQSLVQRLSRFGVSVLPATVGERQVYRVVTGPLPVDDVATERARLGRAGIATAWSLRLCTGDWDRPGCVDWSASES